MCYFLQSWHNSTSHSTWQNSKDSLSTDWSHDLKWVQPNLSWFGLLLFLIYIVTQTGVWDHGWFSLTNGCWLIAEERQDQKLFQRQHLYCSQAMPLTGRWLKKGPFPHFQIFFDNGQILLVYSPFQWNKAKKFNSSFFEYFNS